MQKNQNPKNQNNPPVENKNSTRKKTNFFLRLLLLIPGKQKVSTKEYSRLSGLDKIIFLTWFFGKKIPRIFTIILLILLIALGFMFFRADIEKIPEYDEIQANDYSEIEWKEKADDEGYSKYSDDKSSFDWRAVITPPNRSYLFKILDISQVNFHIKNFKGEIDIPSYIEIKEDDVDFSYSNEIKRITSEEEIDFTLIGKTHYASFLGLSFVSPGQGKIIAINGKPFNIATIQVPNNSKIIKVGDGPYPAGVYEINNLSYLFHNFSNPAIVYYQSVYHFVVQLIIILGAILAFILTYLFVKRIPLPAIDLKTRHFFYLFTAIILMILVLSALFPNPSSLVLNWDNRGTTYKTDGYIYSDKQVTNYLWWTLALTRSIDAMIIGDADIKNCGEGRYRHYYLTQFSVQKFIVLEEFKDNPCAKLVSDMAPKKVVTVSQNNIENELSKLKNRDYFFSFAFVFNIKTVFILSNLLIFMACAFLVWKAFAIKRPRDALFLIIYGFSFFFGLTFLFILVGFLAHMPIGYHGISNLGLIMSNYILPGVFRGGNNLRTLFAFLGCFSVVLFLTSVKKRINLIIYPFFTLIVAILFLVPSTEYTAKRFVLTGIGAEAYVWDYKIDAFNPFDLYRTLRDNEVVQYIRSSFSRETEAKRKMLYAWSLGKELRYGEAYELYNEILVKYKDLNDLVAQAHFELGELSFEHKSLNVLNKEIYEKEIVQPKDYYLRQAIEHYTKAINLAPNAPFIPRAEYRLIRSYRLLKEFSQANVYCFIILNKYPDSSRIAETELLIADNYLRQGDYQNAIRTYQEIINKYPEDESPPEIIADLAYAYAKLGQPDKSYELYSKVISENADDLPLMVTMYSRFQFFITSGQERKLINTSIGAFNVELEGGYKKALKTYNELDGKFSTLELNINNIFRKAEVYRKLSEEADVLDEKRKYWAQADKEYSLIINNYPNTGFAEISKARRKNIEVVRKEKITINPTYDLGEGTAAFDGKNTLYPRKEMHLAGSLQINIPRTSYICGNDICEIGENSTSCPIDCKPDDNFISIRARGQNAAEVWPKMQLYINQRLIYEWEVSNSEFKDFYYAVEFPDHPFQIDIVYPNDDGNSTKDGRSLIIDELTINNRIIPLTSIPELILPTEEEEKLELSTYEKVKSFIAVFLDKINIFKPSKEEPTYPPNYKSLYINVGPSRGISLYFAGAVALFMILLVRKSFRTFMSPLLFFMLARGIIRIAEQDPFRAWYSIPGGVIFGLQIILILIVTNIILYILANPLRFKDKIIETKNVLLSKKKMNEKIKVIANKYRPKV